MGLSLAHHLVYCLLQQHLQLSLLADVTVQLGACRLKQPPLVFHLLAESIDYTFVPDDLLLLRFNFSGRLVDQGTHLRDQ